LFVVASGNDGSNNDVKPIFPASYKNDNIIAVGSTSKLPGEDEKRSFFSNWGPTSVDVAAPGSNIISTWPGDKKYMLEIGTSMAAPHVAGLSALLLSVKPTLTAVEMKRIIMKTVKPLPSLQGKVVSGGRIDPEAALAALRSGEY
jgi:subtilisin family serine protease